MDQNKRDNEKILAAAVRYLLEGNDKTNAYLLINGEITSYYSDQHTWYAEIRGTRGLCEAISNENWYDGKIHTAIKSCLPVYENEDAPVKINARMAVVDVDLDWRAKLVAEVETGVALNQNSFQQKSIIWKGIRFSSEPEVKIAEALERAGIMYLPNCLVRAGAPNNMVSRFPDFLICFDGKWGILEVDGQQYHQGRATEDHERSRIMERHGGISYLTRFDYRRCMQDPDGVVRDFIEVMRYK